MADVMLPAAENRSAAPEDAGHFEFGRNWAAFLSTLDESKIDQAEASIRRLLNVTDLTGKQFLDAGSGSGLFSLAAWRMGASVTSIDLDPQSVACTSELRSRYASDSDRWTVQTGSLLDAGFVESLGAFDFVYCWGVAHHTGRMWTAIENLARRVSTSGRLVIAIYNDQQYISRAWSGVKKIYQRMPVYLRPAYVAVIAAALFFKRLTITVIASALRLATLRNPLTPFLNWIHEDRGRGMDRWHDLVDWVGGWPFEVARPEAIFRFLRDRGFALEELTTTDGHGCNEFVFRRVTHPG
jgi:2-polyprenyl-3-methyl-5-hydroxy-6-metoxy-1,4-benzoquinol methylase